MSKLSQSHHSKYYILVAAMTSTAGRGISKTTSACSESVAAMASTAGRGINNVLSFIVFSLLDILDFLLCYGYKVADFLIEAEWKPCYCSSSITSNGKILLSEQGQSKIVRLITTSTKLQFEEISDTLYNRPSLFKEVSKSTVGGIKRSRLEQSDSSFVSSSPKKRGGGRKVVQSPSSYMTVDSTIMEMLRGKIRRRQQSYPIPRWSDCDCKTCTCWSSSIHCKDTLYVRTDGATDINNVQQQKVEDVLFIHGFISSSAIWTETVFPNFSKSAKSMYRMFAVDLLGFGRSPKPEDSLYTLREHLDMIERSVLEPNKVESFHIVAHSLGCILALALAVKHPGSVKSLTLLAPPYFPVPKGEQGSQYLMRKLAPRKVWPLIAFGASMTCWYEHISRTFCLVLCKYHRFWEFLTRLVTRNRMKTYLMEGFFCHTHNASWHTLHNVICGTAGKLDGYLETVRDHLKCSVTIFHGRSDELIPIECSYNMQSKIPRARVKVYDNKDHITIIIGRQQDFARELEDIWKFSGTSSFNRK